MAAYPTCPDLTSSYSDIPDVLRVFGILNLKKINGAASVHVLAVLLLTRQANQRKGEDKKKIRINLP